MQESSKSSLEDSERSYARWRIATRGARDGPKTTGGGSVSALSGLEKFSHLEDKIYRTIEHCKALKVEKERLEVDVVHLRREVAGMNEEKERLESQLERLYSERDTIKLKVEAMLDAIAVLENEVEAARK